MSALPKEDTVFSWRNLWADLLKGAGTGLLKYDGSRAAQAALAGLEVFDAARERRRQSDPQAPSGAYDDMLLKLLSAMSPGEQAAFSQQSPEEQYAYMEEWAEAEGSDGTSQPNVSLFNRGGQTPEARRPHSNAGRSISLYPLDGLRQSVLPFGPDGSLNLPTFRR